VPLLHLRIVCPDGLDAVLRTLTDRPGVVAVHPAGESSHGPVVTADVARESVEGVIADLRDLGAFDQGLLTLEPLDTSLGGLARRAEDDAPGEGADALIWDELTERTGEDSTLTWTFLAFMVLATLLAAIGVVTDSDVTVVGAMVVGPEFGALAAVAVGLVRRRATPVRRGVVALLVGFPLAVVVTALLALLARAAGLIGPEDITGAGRETSFIYQPGWFSLITALVAGAAGIVSLTSSKSAALVGVFISVTTIPAAGNAAVAATLDRWPEAGRSLANLGINLVGIVGAGVITLAVMQAARRRAR
jgi:uncharacterized hydrophobic protein (TIGR00271 family)